MVFARKVYALMRKIIQLKGFLPETRLSRNLVVSHKQNHLAVLAKGGDLRAQEQLLKSLGGYIRIVCIRYAHDPDLLEDLQQECILAILESLPQYKHSKSAATFFRYKMMTACSNYMARNTFPVKIPPITYRRRKEGKLSENTQYRIDMFCDVNS